MDKKKIITLLQRIKTGKITVQEAYEKLRHLPYEDLGFAKVDHHRQIRVGFPEVVFCQGKTIEQIESIFISLKQKSSTVLLTKIDDKAFEKLKSIAPALSYNRKAMAALLQKKSVKPKGKISIVCAGTADIPVAEEAAITAEAFGRDVCRVYDVGVAGLHRLFGSFKMIASSDCVVAAAGMDGVLPSVIGGLVEHPVIAVPTSIGYGANFQGIAPLLTMLNSCAPNVTVVNINNGFGAGYVASLIAGGKR